MTANIPPSNQKGKIAFILAVLIIVAFIVLLPIQSSRNLPGQIVSGQGMNPAQKSDSSSSNSNTNFSNTAVQTRVLGLFDLQSESSSSSNSVVRQPSPAETPNNGWLRLPELSSITGFFAGLGQRLMVNSPRPQLELSTELKNQSQQNTSLAEVNIFDKARNIEKDQAIEGRIVWKDSLAYTAGTDKFNFGSALDIRIADRNYQLTVDSSPLLTTDTVLMVDKTTFEKLGGDTQKQTELQAVVKKRQND